MNDQLRPAVHSTIVVVDVEGFGNLRRNNANQVVVREALYGALQQAFAKAKISWAACRHEDRGDGVLVLAPAEVPKELFVGVPVALSAALREHNESHPVEEQIRLRVALHAGEVVYDDRGVTAASINRAFRLLDAAPLKTALGESPGALALITSEWFFDEVVRHSHQTNPATFRQVRIVVKETSTVAWIALPDHPYPPDPAHLTPTASKTRAKTIVISVAISVALLTAAVLLWTQLGPPQPGTSGNGTTDTAAAPATSVPASIGAVTAAVEWVDGFCGAVNGFLSDWNDVATDTEGDSIVEIQRSTSAQFGDIVEVLDRAITAVAALPQAPNSTAETAARTARNNYITARQTAATAKTELDAAAPDDEESLERAADAMMETQVHAHKSLDPVGALLESPELADASAVAPNCR